jgi:S1-C subfamily serine protease
VSTVDVVLVLLMIVFAVSGYRQGFVIGILSFFGFFGGALIGLQLGPAIANRFADGAIRVVVSLIAVFGLAVLGQALTGWLGTHVRGAITSHTARRLDDAGGAIVSVLAVLVVAWLVAVPLASSSVPWLASSVRNSRLLDGVDKVLPEQAQALSESLRDTVNTQGFPDVFGGLAATRAREVAAPDPKLVGSKVVADARKSVVKVLGSAPACGRRIEGSGFVYAAERVMTNAHVVAGTRTVSIEVDGDRHNGRVVVYDPDRDLAVIYVPELTAPVMEFADEPAAADDDAIVLGFPLDGPYNAQSARVREVGEITGPDIYDSSEVTRQIYTIRALVRSGNSGGPLVDTKGDALGIIFAAAADDRTTGFAVTAAEAASVANNGAERSRAVGTGDCV